MVPTPAIAHQGQQAGSGWGRSSAAVLVAAAGAWDPAERQAADAVVDALSYYPWHERLLDFRNEGAVTIW